MTVHYQGEDLIIRKIRVGDMENNTYVLECPVTHDALLIDGCFEPDRILDESKAANLVGIVQTHGHGDHVQALRDLKRRLNVPVYAHPGETYPVEIDVKLTDGDVLGFGERDTRVIHTPGHTPGGVCLLSGRHLISGDTLFPGGPGNTRGNKRDFGQIIESISSKLFVLPDDTVVYPGHGADTTIGTEKPHLQEWIDRGW
jgi:glyoxylase-like metal-dependent hydrolase (beta-lactamase superfamily II)